MEKTNSHRDDQPTSSVTQRVPTEIWIEILKKLFEIETDSGYKTITMIMNFRDKQSMLDFWPKNTGSIPEPIFSRYRCTEAQMDQWDSSNERSSNVEDTEELPYGLNIVAGGTSALLPLLLTCHTLHSLANEVIFSNCWFQLSYSMVDGLQYPRSYITQAQAQSIRKIKHWLHRRTYGHYDLTKARLPVAIHELCWPILTACKKIKTMFPALTHLALQVRDVSVADVPKFMWTTKLPEWFAVKQRVQESMVDFGSNLRHFTLYISIEIPPCKAAKEILKKYDYGWKDHLWCKMQMGQRIIYQMNLYDSDTITMSDVLALLDITYQLEPVKGLNVAYLKGVYSQEPGSSPSPIIEEEKIWLSG